LQWDRKPKTKLSAPQTAREKSATSATGPQRPIETRWGQKME
jgi:hypothetical protein